VKSAVVAALLASSLAYADEPVDLVTELRAIGGAVKQVGPPHDDFVAGAGCGKVDKIERAAIQRRVVAWIDHEHPDEVQDNDPDGAGPLVLHAGCHDPAGFVGVDVSQDRKPKKGPFGTRRNYILRVFPDRIEAVEDRTSTPSKAWSEWADEGRLELLGQLDLDGDGALDLVVGHYEREGGAPLTHTDVSVRFATGKTAPVVTASDLGVVGLVAGQLVIDGADKAGHTYFACVGNDLRLSSCHAIGELRRGAERRAIADRYAAMTAADLPDRDQLAADLAVLGIVAPKLLGAAAETAPDVRVTRHVARWAARTGLRYDFAQVMQQVYPEARVYLDRLEAALGDATCTNTPLTAAETAAVTTWVERQDAKPARVTIEAAPCGPYAWAAWEREGEGMRREVLLSRDGTTRLLGFTWPVGMAMGQADFGHTDAFFAHGDAIVGIVIASVPGAQGDYTPYLWIVSSGKVVAQSRGPIGFYSYGAGSAEHSADIVDDGGVLWHATPAGRVRLDPALVHDHEARRAALALVLDGTASGSPAYLAALKLLGADAALVAEARKLAP
jgi:hypothetical protein